MRSNVFEHNQLLIAQKLKRISATYCTPKHIIIIQSDISVAIPNRYVYVEREINALSSRIERCKQSKQKRCSGDKPGTHFQRYGRYEKSNERINNGMCELSVLLAHK